MSTAKEARTWFQTKYPDIPAEDVEELIRIFSPIRKNADWESVKKEWTAILSKSNRITTKEAKGIAKLILGNLFNNEKYGMAFKRWKVSIGLSQVDRVGNLRVYAKDTLPNTPMGKIKGLVQENKPVDLSHILKDHKLLVEEAKEYLSQNGYRKGRDNIWRYVNE
mgnify:CR=1 FL=1